MLSSLHCLSLIPRVVYGGARSFLSWLRIPADTIRPTEIQDRARLRDMLGWVSPEMIPHWSTYKGDPSFHHLKNLGSKWVRLDPQRAYKVGSFVIAGLVSIIIALLIVLAVLLWLIF